MVPLRWLLGFHPPALDSAAMRINRGAVRLLSTPYLERLRRQRTLLPIALTILAVMASVVTHVVGGGPLSGEVGGEAGEAAEHSAVFLPPMLGPLGSLLLIGAIWLVRGRSLKSVWFFLVPPLAFGLQELAERAFHVGSPPFGASEPTLLMAVLVQLPFAGLAIVLARLLRAGVRTVIAFLRVRRQWPRLASASTPIWTLAPVWVPNLPAPAGAHFGRAPPDLR